MNFTEQQIKKQFELLPDEIQENLFSSEIEHRVRTAGDAVGLSPDKVKELNAFVNYVILELLSEAEFPAVCEENFGLEPKDAQELSQIISLEIFGPMREMRAHAIEAQAIRDAEEIELFGEQYNSKFEPRPEENSGVRAPGAVPKNLPTEEEFNSFLPKLTPKIPVHPFEEKMKDSLASAGSQVVSTPESKPFHVSATIKPITPTSYQGDPYRESLE